MKLAMLLLAFTLLASFVEANALQETEKPDFSTISEVITSFDTMIANLEEEARVQFSWQVGRALDNCTEARRIIERWPDVGAYDSRGAERLWKDCKSTYDAVP